MKEWTFHTSGDASGRVLLHVATVGMTLSFLRGQASYIAAKGLTIHVACAPGPELAPFSAREAAITHAVPMRRAISPLSDVVAVVRLVNLIRQLQPDIVHSHTPKGGLLGMIAATLAGVAIRIYHIRGLPHTTATGFRRRLFLLTEWCSCRLAHSVLCVSHSMRTEAIRRGLVSPHKARVLAGGSGNGVDARDRFNPDQFDQAARAQIREELCIPSDAVVVGYIGRLARDKGIVELSRAWTQIQPRLPKLFLLMVGPDEASDEMTLDAIRTLRADVSVRIHGADWNTPRLFACMDIVVLPTYREGFPNVLLEAAAMALPVVATNVPGCTDAVVDGSTGTLVSVADVNAIGYAIQTYATNPMLRRAHGDAARSRVLDQFSQEALWNELYQHYAQLLSTQRVLSHNVG